MDGGRGPCESAEIDGMGRGVKGQVGGCCAVKPKVERKGGEGDDKTYYSAPPDSSHSHFP